MYAIPKIEYNFVTKSGSSAGGSDFLNVSDVVGLYIGMRVRGTGIPNGATISAIGIGVQISMNATGAGSSFEFFREVEFEYPPIEEEDEAILPRERKSTSLSGVHQTSVDYVERVRSLIFSHLSPVIYSKLQDFFSNHGVFDRDFRYYEDKTTGDFIVYTLRTLEWRPKKVGLRGLMLVPLQFRRLA